MSVHALCNDLFYMESFHVVDRHRSLARLAAECIVLDGYRLGAALYDPLVIKGVLVFTRQTMIQLPLSIRGGIEMSLVVPELTANPCYRMRVSPPMPCSEFFEQLSLFVVSCNTLLISCC